jgi:hypothetical protein
MIPSVDVATQRVEVPVDQSTCPRVPDAVVESRKVPATKRLVAVAEVIAKLVEDPSVAKKVVAVALVEKRLEVDALTAAKLFVAVALLKVVLPRVVWPVTVSPVADAVARLDCPCTVRIPVVVRLVEEALARVV